MNWYKKEYATQSSTHTSSPFIEARPSYPSTSNMLSSTYSLVSGLPAFKLDEGFSEDPRGQDDTDLATTMENTSGFEEWVMAQSEDARAGKATAFAIHYHLCGSTNSDSQSQILPTRCYELFGHPKSPKLWTA
jgi:hypothetical protein